MAYWRLRRTFTVPDVLGFSLASSGNPGIDGDYYRTSQTCNNAPVFLRAAAGGAPAMYLFLAYDSQCTAEAAWYLASEVHQYMSEELDEDPWISYYPYSGCRSMMDYYDVDVTRPDAAMLSGTWSRNDGQTGSYSATASELLDTACPLLDASGTDGFGHVRRFPSSLDIPREGLVFDAPLASQAAKALTGQALTYDITASGTIFETVGGLPCMRGTWIGGDGHITVTFPDSALPSGSAARTVSLWAYPTAGFTEDMMWICWGDPSAQYGQLCNLGTKSGNYPTSVALWANRNHDDWFSGIQLTLNAWWHVVFIAAYGRVEAWVNGVRKGDYAWSIDTKPTGTAWLGTDYGGNGFEGRLAGVRVYDRVLSEAEILRLFNEHKEVVP